MGIVSPWNYPLTLAVTDALAAMMAGNAVVLRPDLQTSLTALYAADLLAEAGLPEGVLQVVIGSGSTVGQAVLDTCDYVCFTGSTATGRAVAERAGRRLVGMSLELGGKNGCYVRADADLDLAVDVAVRSSFASAGQLCMHTERLILDESIAEDFLARFIPAVEALRVGVGLTYGVDMGSLLGAEQLGTVQRHVDDARAKGPWSSPVAQRSQSLGPMSTPRPSSTGSPGDALPQRRDLRAGRLDLPGRLRRGGPDPDERHRVRPARHHRQPGRPPGRCARQPDPDRVGEHQRHVCRGMGLEPRHARRDEGLRDRAAARQGGSAALHRTAECHHPAAAPDETGRFDDRRPVRLRDDGRDAGHEEGRAELTPGRPGARIVAPSDEGGPAMTQAAYDYDVIVVGSGFGGSVAALRLAEKGYRVHVLESGRRFSDDDFATTSWDLRRYLWAPRLGCFWRPAHPQAARRHAPRGRRRRRRLAQLRQHLAGCPAPALLRGPAVARSRRLGVRAGPHYATASRMLGVVTNPCEGPVEKVMREAADELGVGTPSSRPRSGLRHPGDDRPGPFFGGAGPARTGCTECGNCMVGCRIGAKNTLVKNYLALAERLGVTVEPLRTVVHLRPLDPADPERGYG